MNTIVLAARIKDNNILINSSSGGMFTAISDFFLNQGNAVVCSSYNYELNENEFKLILTKQERDKARGSKYIQSKVKDIFSEALRWLKKNPNKELLFVGTGCQAQGFKLFLDQYRMKDRVTFVDIICHGVPSPNLWSDYISKFDKIEYLTFKDKRNGWQSPTAFVISNGREIPIQDYVKVYFCRYSLRPSCYKCPYCKVHRNTDLTIGDFWGIQKVLPQFYSNLGTSLILIHSQKGKKLWENIKSNLEYIESTEQDCLQPNLVAATKKPIGRSKFWFEYKKLGINYITKKYGNDSIVTRLRWKLTKIKKKG